MALKSGYQGIKKVTDNLILTLEGTLDVNVSSELVEGDQHPASGGAVEAALKKKLDTYASDPTQWDAIPTASSTKPVISGGEYKTAVGEYKLVKDTVGFSGKNRLPVTISELKRLNTAETWSGNVYVRYNITFSVTTDDDGNVTEIDAHGTATGAVYFSVGNMNIGSSAMDSIDNPKANGYILSAHDSVHLKYSTSSHNFVFDIPNGAQLNHVKLYPMLRRDDIVDDTYEPYHAPVSQAKADNSVIAPVEDGTNASQAYALGSHFIRGGKFCKVTTAMAQDDELAGKYVDEQLGDFILKICNFSTVSVTAGGYEVKAIPTITGYTPALVTPLVSGVGALPYAVTKVTHTNNVPEKVVFVNTDSSDHSWHGRATVLYVKNITVE